MTDAELTKLEKRIAAIYREAYNDLTDTIRDYFGKFAARDAVERRGWTLGRSRRINTSCGVLLRLDAGSGLKR